MCPPSTTCKKIKPLLDRAIPAPEFQSCRIVEFVGRVVPLEILGPGFAAQIIDNRNDPKTAEHVVLWKILWK